MKTGFAIVLLFLIVLSCVSRKPVSTSTSIQKNTQPAPTTESDPIVISPEPFDTFILKFVKDTAFRRTRIKYPLRYGEVINSSYQNDKKLMSVDWNTNLLPADIDTYQIKIDSERSGAALSPDSTRTLRWRKDNTAPYRDDVRASFTLSNNNRQPIKVYIYHFYPQDGQWFLDDIIVGIHNRLTPQPDPDGIVLITEKNAEPSVGRAAYNEYLAKNLRYPHKAKENKIQARVFVEFIIERDGTLSNIKAVRNVPVGYGCEEEAERLIKEGPQWLPAEQNKQKVRQRITLPITFKLE